MKEEEFMRNMRRNNKRMMTEDPFLYVNNQGKEKRAGKKNLKTVKNKERRWCGGWDWGREKQLTDF